MPTVSRLDNIRPAFFDNNGDPLVGGKLFFYRAGTTTKENTYNSSSGSVANTNPIVLNSRGEPGVEIWLDTAYLYKVVLAPSTDTDPPASPIWTEDNIDPINRSPIFTQGTSLVWGPTVTIPDSGTYFTVTSGSGAASTLSSASTNAREISIRFNVSGCSLTHNPPALSLQNDASRSVILNDVVSFIKDTGGWIEQSAKNVATNVALATDFAYGNVVQAGSRLIFPRSYIAGCEIANNSGAPTSSIDFAAGVCRDNANAQNIINGGTITKSLDISAWAQNSGQPGRFSAAVLADGTWHCFLIRNDSTGVIDAGFDTSVTAANRPAGWTAFRRVGSILRVSGLIVAFSQFGNEFIRSVPIQDYSTAALGTTAVLQALSVPTGIKVRAQIATFASRAALGYVLVTSPDAADTPPTATVYTLYCGGTAGTYSNAWMQVRTNTSAQIRLRSSGASTNAEIYTHGWMDERQ